MFFTVVDELLYLDPGEFFLDGQVLVDGGDVVVGGGDDLFGAEDFYSSFSSPLKAWGLVTSWINACRYTGRKGRLL
jgi:hypothetical protein